MEDKKKISFDDACKLAQDILEENTDSYILFAAGHGRCVSAAVGSSGDLIGVIAKYMEQEEIRSVILSAVAVFAKNNGNVTELKIPQDISSN